MAWASVRAALVPALDAPSKPITTAEQLESDLETSYAAACKLHAQTGFRADSSADSRIIRDVCNAYARVVSSPLFALPEHQPSSRARMIRFLSLKNGGLLWATTADTDAAIACLLQALDCPVDSHDQASCDDVTLWRTLVQLAIRKSNFALSRALLERSRRLFPQCTVLRDLELETLWALGESAEVVLKVVLGVLSDDASHIPARLILVNIFERNQSSAFLQSVLEMLSTSSSKYAQNLCRSLKSSGSVQNLLVELKLNLSRTASRFPVSFDACRSKLLAVRQSHCNDVAVDPSLLASAAALTDLTSSELVLKSHVWKVVRAQSIGNALAVTIPVMALLSDMTAPKSTLEEVKQPEIDSEIQLVEPLEPVVPSQAAEPVHSVDLTWNGLDVSLVVHCRPLGMVEPDTDVTLQVIPDSSCLIVKLSPSTGSGESEFSRFHAALHKLTSLLDEFKSQSLDHIVHTTTPIMLDPISVPTTHVPRRLDLSAFAGPPTIDADVMSDSSPPDSPRNEPLSKLPELASADNNQSNLVGNSVLSVPSPRVYLTDLFVQPAVSESTNPSEFHTLAQQALNSDASVCVHACQSHSQPISQFIQLCCASVPGMSLAIDEAACSITFLPPQSSTKSAETDVLKFGVDRTQFLCEQSPFNQPVSDRSNGSNISSRPPAALNLNITPFKTKGKSSGSSAHTIVREINLFIEQFARGRNLGVRDLLAKWSEYVCFNSALSAAAQRVSLQEPLQWFIPDLTPARDPLRLNISLAELKLAALMHHGKLTEIKDIELLLQKTRVALLEFECQANGFISSNVFSDISDLTEQITADSTLLTELDTEALSDFRLSSCWTSSPLKSTVLRWLWLTARLAALRLELKNTDESQRLQKSSASSAGQWWKRLEFVMMQLGFDSTTCFSLHESSNSENTVSELGVSCLKQLLSKMELSLLHVTAVMQQLRFDRLLERVQRLLNARQFETVLGHTAVPLLNVALGGLVHPKYKRARAAANTASADEKEAHDKATAEAVQREWTSCLQVWNSLSQSHQTRLLNMFRQAAVQQQDSFVCLAVTMAQLQCCAREAQLICQSNEQPESSIPVLSTPQVKTPSKLSLSATKAARETPSQVTTTEPKKTKKIEQVDVSTICDLLARYVLDVEAVLNNVQIDVYPIASPLQQPTGHVSTHVDFNSDLAAMAEIWAPLEKLNGAKTMRKLSKMLSATALARFQQALGVLLLCGSKLCTVPLRTDQCCVSDKVSSDEETTTKASFVTSRMVSAVLLAAVVGARFMDSKYNIDLVSPQSSSSSAPSAPTESMTEPSTSPPARAVVQSNSQSTDVISLQNGADIAMLSCLSQEPIAPLASVSSNSTFVVDAALSSAVLIEHQRRLRCCYRVVALMCSAHTLLAANQACRQSQLDADRRILRLWANLLLRHPVIRSAFHSRFVDLQSPLTSTQLSLSEIYFRELSRTMLCLHNIELRSSVLNCDLMRQWNRHQQPTIDEPAIEVYHRAHEFCPPGRLSPLFKGVCGVLDASQFDDTYLKFVVDAIIRNAAYLRVRRQIACANESDTRLVLGIPFQPVEPAWSLCLIEHTVLCDELCVHALHVLHSGEEVLKHPTVTVAFDKKPRVECVTAWLRSLSALTSTLPGQSIQMFRPHADDSCLLDVYRFFQGGLHNSSDTRLDGLVPYWPVLKLKDDNKRKLDEVSWTNVTDTELAAMSKTERLAIKKARLAAVREMKKTDDGDVVAEQNDTSVMPTNTPANTPANIEKITEVIIESSQAESKDVNINESKQKHFLSKIISVVYFYRASESYLSYLLSNFDRLCGRAVTLSFSNQIWPTSLSDAQQMFGVNDVNGDSVVQPTPFTLHNTHTVYFGPKSRLNMSETDMTVLLSDLKHLAHALLAIWPSSPLPLWAIAVRHRELFESLFQQSTTLSFSSRSMSDSSWQSNFVASQRCTLAALMALQKLDVDQSWKRLPTMLGRQLSCATLKFQMLERYAVTEFRAFQIALVDSLNSTPISVTQSFAPTHRAMFRAEEVQLLKSMFPGRQFNAESETGLSLLQLQSQRVCSIMHVVAAQADFQSKWLCLLLRARAAEQCGTIEPFQIMEMFSEADAACPSSVAHAMVSLYWQRARLTMLSLVKYWIDQLSFQAADMILIALCEWSAISALKPPSQDMEQCVSWMSQTISSDRQSVQQQLHTECRVRLHRACRLLPWHTMAHNELAYTALQAGEQEPAQLRRMQWLLAPFVTLNRRGREGTADDLDRLSPAFRYTVSEPTDSTESSEQTDWNVLYPWRQNIEQGSTLESVQRLLAIDLTPYHVETETLRSAHLYLELAARRGFSEGATAVHEVWDLLTRRLKLDQLPPINYMLLCARFALLNMALFLVNPERICTENDAEFDAAELVCPLAVDICIKLARMHHQLPELVVCAHQMALRQFTVSKCRTVLQTAPVLADLVSCVDMAVLPMHEHLQLFRGRFDVLHAVGDCRLRECILQSSQWTQVEQLGNCVSDEATVQLLRSDGDASHLLDVFGIVMRIHQTASLTVALDWASECRWARKLLPATGAGRGSRTLQQTLSALQNRFAPVLRPLPVDEEMQEIDLLQDESNQQ